MAFLQTQLHTAPGRGLPRRASIQQAKVFLEGVQDGVVVLTGEEYRVILEVFALNFDLKSPAEQEAIVESFRALLNSLTFPIQILVRIERLDVEGYAALVRGRAAETDEPALRELALAQLTLVRELASSRLLLGRRFFVVIPAVGASGPATSGVLGWAGLRRERREDSSSQLASARRQLLLRSEEVARGLSAVGVRSRSLGTQDVLALYRDILSPGLAHVQPLHEHLADQTTPAVRAHRTLADAGAL